MNRARYQAAVRLTERRDRPVAGLDGGHEMSDQYGGASTPAPRKVTVPDLVAMKRDGKRITMMTAYDAAFARLVDQAGIDVILVGDSLGMVVLGYPTTVPVTMDDMVRHAAAVSRGATRPLLVGDMPFGTYQAGPQDALRNAARFLKEAGMDAVKLEGGHEVVLHDVLGLFGEFKPKFAKRYADIGTAVVEALREYDRDVRAGTFPDDEHSFTMKESELVSLQRSLTQKAG